MSSWTLRLQECCQLDLIPDDAELAAHLCAWRWRQYQCRSLHRNLIRLAHGHWRQVVTALALEVGAEEVSMIAQGCHPVQVVERD